MFKEGYQDPTVLTRTILSGAADVNGDTPPPPAELQSILANSKQKQQLTFTPTGGSRYVALNTRKAPFNSPLVRRAVADVLDRNAMRLTRGGTVDGRIATHFIDPSFRSRGFTQAGGQTFDPFPSPGFSGSVAKAKALLKQAGFANGMYSGPQVTMVSDNSPPGSNTAQVVAADLAKIGFSVKTIAVTHATMYTRFCNVPKNEPNICPNVGWLPDFHDPQTILDVTFNGKNITSVNNSNWPLLNDPSINAAIARAKLPARPGPARWRGMGQDRQDGHAHGRRCSLALGDLPDVVLDAGHARAGAVERRQPGRDLHGGPRGLTSDEPRPPAETSARLPARRPGRRAQRGLTAR